jgi:hypothetical protein
VSTSEEDRKYIMLFPRTALMSTLMSKKVGVMTKISREIREKYSERKKLQSDSDDKNFTEI